MNFHEMDVHAHLKRTLLALADDPTFRVEELSFEENCASIFQLFLCRYLVDERLASSLIWLERNLITCASESTDTTEVYEHVSHALLLLGAETERCPYEIEADVRHPTAEAISNLAERLSLPHSDLMQDWEFEVASVERLPDFVAAYKSADMSDDERFVLMLTIIESVNQAMTAAGSCREWQDVLGFLESDFELHLSTIAYFAMPGWPTAPELKQFYLRHVRAERRFN